MQRDIAQYRSTCGQTLGVVLATGPEALFELNTKRDGHANTVVCSVVDEACWAQVAFVYVVVAPQVGQDVTRVVHLVKRSKNAPLVQVVECDDELLRATLDGSSTEVIEALFDVSPVDCDSAIIMHADHPLVTAEQLYGICLEGRSAIDAGSLSVPNEGAFPYFMIRS